MASAGPPFAVAPGVMDVLATLWAVGHGAYLVGGGVRDALLGLEVTDWDVATDARPERLLAIFPGSTYQNRFGTVLAQGHEITTLRRDHHYADHRRPDTVVFSDDIYEDLARRDLTINAIAWGRSGPDATARMIDPADGQGDLDARLVRAVGDPGRRFDEDALRLLRAIRFAARLDFAIEPVTWGAMKAHAGDIAYVSEERIGSEVRRMLTAPGPSRAWRLLLESGLLVAVAPEFEKLTQAAADEEETAFDAAMGALDQAIAEQPGDERLALAALLVPLGPTRALDVLKRLRVAGRDSDAISELIDAAAVDYQPTWSDADVRRYMRAMRGDLLDALLVLRRARATGHDAAEVLEAGLASRVAAQQDADAPLSLAQLAIDGGDLRDTLGVPEGPTIGIILERLMDDVLEEPVRNSRETLLVRAAMLLDDLGQERRGGADPAAIR